MGKPTLFDAMNAFRKLAQVKCFTTNEIALFYAILDTWNIGGRPEVVEQWAERTFILSGLKKNTLPTTRNKLIQQGVIFFQKKGKRGVPQYSLGALLGNDTPFQLLPKSGHKHGHKPRVNTGINPASYKEEDKSIIKPPTPKGESEVKLNYNQLEAQIVVKWNQLPPPIRKLRGQLTKSAHKVFLRRIKEDEFLADWEEAIDSIAFDPHCLGNNDRGWVATIDYFLRPETIGKLLSRKSGRDLKKKSTSSKPQFRTV